MITARHDPQPFKKGTNWTLTFRVEDLDLTAATVLIVIKRVGTGETLFTTASDGTFSKTLSGTDTIILWDIPYTVTNATGIALGRSYQYDMEVTSGGAKHVYLEGTITVTANI